MLHINTSICSAWGLSRLKAGMHTPLSSPCPAGSKRFCQRGCCSLSTCSQLPHIEMQPPTLSHSSHRWLSTLWISYYTMHGNIDQPPEGPGQWNDFVLIHMYSGIQEFTVICHQPSLHLASACDSAIIWSRGVSAPKTRWGPISQTTFWAAFHSFSVYANVSWESGNICCQQLQVLEWPIEFSSLSEPNVEIPYSRSVHVYSLAQ